MKNYTQHSDRKRISLLLISHDASRRLIIRRERERERAGEKEREEEEVVFSGNINFPERMKIYRCGMNLKKKKKKKK